MSFGQGSFLQGPGIGDRPGGGREDIPQGDLAMLERAGLIQAIRYSQRDGNPTYVLTPEAHEHYLTAQSNDPEARQEADLRRFLDSDRFQRDYPKAYTKWAEADALLWRADSDGELTTVGHKAREALQEFATEAVGHYSPEDAEANPALVNKRLGSVIASFASRIGESRFELLKALGAYSEATVSAIQRQEHGGQKEGEALNWKDAKRVVFHAGFLMHEFAEAFYEASEDQVNSG